MRSSLDVWFVVGAAALAGCRGVVDGAWPGDSNGNLGGGSGVAAAGGNGPAGGVATAGVGGGASPDDAGPAIPNPPFEALGVDRALVKVKSILTGLAPSDEELAAVRANESALPALIDAWLDTPEASQKLRDFFQVAFQQGAIVDKSLNDQLACDFHSLAAPNPRVTKLLLDNVEESFSRTALHIALSDQPFSNVLTTREYYLTPGLAGLLAYLDYHVVRDDKQFRGDSAFPLEFSIYHDGGPTPFADQVKNRRFYTRDANLGAALSDPLVSRNPFQLYLHLMGIILGTSLNFPEPSFTPEDMSQWRLYRIRQPQPGEAATPFWDLERLRTTQELVLELPRVGFFTTPAFFATWQTNDSNQHRLTTNQTLIVALGKSFVPQAGAIPVREVSLDDAHASQAECRFCHVQLDPMRAYFRQAYSLAGSHQTDPQWSMQAGSFAFAGETHDGGDLYTFAETLARHPAFATAWVQKLCQWANSSPCSEADPELLRVVAVFKDSGLSFRQLVRELFSSPLITERRRTQTSDEHGQLVSVARFSHLCRALEYRLGLDDPCGTRDPSSAAYAVSVSIPADAFSRGKPEPILPTESNLFHRTAVETLCSLVAERVVNRDGTKVKMSTQDVRGSLESMVRIVMNVTDADPKQPAILELLQKHYDAALAASSNDAAALASAFTLACTSPISISVGL